MKQSKASKITGKIMTDLENTFQGAPDYGGYDYSHFADAIFEVVQEYTRHSIEKSLATELDKVRKEIRAEFTGVKAENARLKTQLEFYKGIEAAAKKKVKEVEPA